MRGGITAVAALVLLGALWFLAGDDDGRNAVPRLFDNMNDRPLADAQQVGISSAAPDRKTRLAPPRSVAQSLGMNGTGFGRSRRPAGADAPSGRGSARNRR